MADRMAPPISETAEHGSATAGPQAAAPGARAARGTRPVRTGSIEPDSAMGPDVAELVGDEACRTGAARSDRAAERSRPAEPSPGAGGVAADLDGSERAEVPRARAIAGFLRRAGWGGAKRAALAGDASGRRYERLTDAARTAVLMDAPPGPEGRVRAFLDVAGRLSALGLSPPAVLAAEPGAGLLLLEDLGDALLARVAAAEPAREVALYEAAADVLAVLRAAGPPEGLPLYDAGAMAEATALTGPWYARAEAVPWTEPLHEALDTHAGRSDAMVLRDYHAENLVWLPDRQGPASVGLLDFQDALRGPAAYDLASLIQDARRDVSPAAARAAVARFAEGDDPARLHAALAVVGAQRALRILGVFGRLARRDGKPRYLPLLPRVWGHLTACLAHPACAGLRGPVLGALPPPDAAHLEGLRCCP